MGISVSEDDVKGKKRVKLSENEAEGTVQVDGADWEVVEDLADAEKIL